MMLTWCKPFRKQKDYYFLWCSFCVLLWIWNTLGVLSVNRMALHSIAKKFDFWAKLVFVFVFIIAYSIWRVATTHHIETNAHDFDSIAWYIIQTILMGIDFILLVLYYSLIHGMPISYKAKSRLGCMLSILCTCMALQLLLCSANNEQDIKLKIYAPYLSVSLYAISVSCIMVLTLFLWKSVYLISRYKRKSAAVGGKVPAKQHKGVKKVQLKTLPKFEPVNTDSRYIMEDAVSPKMQSAMNRQRSPSQCQQNQICCVDLKCIELQLEQNPNVLPILPMIVQTQNDCNEITSNVASKSTIPITRHCDFPCPDILQRNDAVLPISTAV